MKKVVFLGSKFVGYECLKHLYDQRNRLDLELIAVLTNLRGEKIIEFCREKSITIIDNLDEFANFESCDIAISAQYHKILKKEHIEKARKSLSIFILLLYPSTEAAINFHVQFSMMTRNLEQQYIDWKKV